MYDVATGLVPVQELALHDVPVDTAGELADLVVAGRYVPAGAGLEPIAGDFYDLLALQPDLLAIVVGDVSGHGLGAASRMHQLRAATRAHAFQQPGPRSLLARLDTFMDLVHDESLATLWYGEYQPSTGRLTYSSAGHPPPVLTCHGEQTQLLELASSPPLGTGVAHRLAQDHVVELPPGAVLVAYSDGLVERHDTDLDDQLALLQSIVTASCDPATITSAHDIATEIMDALVPEPERAEDDVCLLVVRRQPQG